MLKAIGSLFGILTYLVLCCNAYHPAPSINLNSSQKLLKLVTLPKLVKASFIYRPLFLWDTYFLTPLDAFLEWSDILWSCWCSLFPPCFHFSYKKAPFQWYTSTSLTCPFELSVLGLWILFCFRCIPLLSDILVMLCFFFISSVFFFVCVFLVPNGLQILCIA